MGTAELAAEAGYWVFLTGGALTAFLLLGAGNRTRGRDLLAGGLGGLTCLGGMLCLAGICGQTGRPPLSGAFEALFYSSFLMGLLALYAQLGRNASPRLAGLAWVSAALLAVSLLVAPRRVNPDWYMYQFIWSQLFFLLRLTALPLLFYASLTALTWPQGESLAGVGRNQVLRARRFLLLGTAVFLLGELSGFYWCLTWLGDYWRWNRNFLESALFFLLAGVALHLPPRMAIRPGVLRLAYAAPGCVAMFLWLLHQIGESMI